MKRQLLISVLIFCTILSLNGQWSGTNPVWTNSNVGIGTTAPGYKLEVNGDIGIRSTGKFYLASDLGNPPYIKGNWLNNDYSGMEFHVFNNTVDVTALYLKEDGKVGIGLTPNSPLTVYQATALGGTIGNYQPIADFKGNTQGTEMQMTTWLYRERTGTDWTSTAILTGVGMGTYNNTPGSNVRLWWKLDPYDNKMSFGSSASAIMTLKTTTGFVGIGTTADPNYRLEVAGDIGMIPTSWTTGSVVTLVQGDAQNFLKNSYGSPMEVKGYHGVIASSQAGIAARLGTASNSLNSEFYGNVTVAGEVTASKYNATNTTGYLLRENTGSGYGIYKGATDRIGITANGTEWLTILSGGNVGIGTTNPGDYKLNVSGRIRANEVVVNTSGADYVFASSYKLPTLSEVESFIKVNKHLPDIPSASEMAEKGLNVSEMQTKLLLKMEEMTLYIIEQNKMNEKQSKKMESQSIEIELLKKEISLLKKNNN